MIATASYNGVAQLIIQNELLKVTVVPQMGGKISSIVNKNLNKEFLWLNQSIPFETKSPGSEYDPNFIGGIDELIPNDIPENIDGIDYPDHGELWTTPLSHNVGNEVITVSGHLSSSQLFYSKSIRLANDQPTIILDYLLRNDSNSTRHYMWKLHAALNIRPGDKLVTNATFAQVVDPAYSRFKKELAPFIWPLIEDTDASIIPSANNTMDFFYLFGGSKGSMQLHSEAGNHVFAYDYDEAVFPYQWWFASYGGFLDHYTAILEPCTNMPIAVNQAIQQQQSASLDPGSTLTTQVRIFAGEKKKYFPL